MDYNTKYLAVGKYLELFIFAMPRPLAAR